MKKPTDISQLLTTSEYRQRIKDNLIKISVLSFGRIDIKFTSKKHPYFKIINQCNLPAKVVYSKTKKQFVIKSTTVKKVAGKRILISDLRFSPRQIMLSVAFFKEVCKILNHYLVQLPVNVKSQAWLKAQKRKKSIFKLPQYWIIEGAEYMVGGPVESKLSRKELVERVQRDRKQLGSLAKRKCSGKKQPYTLHLCKKPIVFIKSPLKNGKFPAKNKFPLPTEVIDKY